MASSSNSSDLNKSKKIQDIIFSISAGGVSIAFMLFLLGSTSVLTSLSMIGVLLCLSLCASIFRFYSMGRADAELTARQNDLDIDMRTVQTRVNDHDLVLLDMVGRIEHLEDDIQKVKRTQDESAHQNALFMKGLKDRMVQLMGMISARDHTATFSKTTPSETKKTAGKRGALSSGFFRDLHKTANDAGVIAPRTPFPVSRYEDDLHVSPALVREALDVAVSTGRIDVYVQPVVTLPQRQVQAYELYGRVRLKPGVYIPATQYRGLAAHEGYQTKLDQYVLREIPALVAQLGDVTIMANIQMDALKDKGTLVDLIHLVKRTPALKEKLVICLSGRDVARMEPRLETVLFELQRAGIVFGMNDVPGIDLDLNRLARLGFKYLKLPHDKIMTTIHSNQGAELVQRFITRVAARNIHLIVGGVETPEQLRVMLDYPVPFAQGHAFGRPDRPIVYQPRAKAA